MQVQNESHAVPVSSFGESKSFNPAKIEDGYHNVVCLLVYVHVYENLNGMTALTVFLPASNLFHPAETMTVYKRRVNNYSVMEGDTLQKF